MSLPSDWLAFFLVAGMTAVVVFVMGGFVLWLTARARTRRHAGSASPNS